MSTIARKPHLRVYTSGSVMHAELHLPGVLVGANKVELVPEYQFPGRYLDDWVDECWGIADPNCPAGPCRVKHLDDLSSPWSHETCRSDVADFVERVRDEARGLVDEYIRMRRDYNAYKSYNLVDEFDVDV